MTSLLEKTISVIAPHRCIVCSNYDNVVCTACMYDIHRLEVPLCVLCGSPTTAWRTCASCARTTSLRGVIAAAPYEGVLAELIRRYKFDHARAAYRPLATLLASSLPAFSAEWLVVPVPTVAAHIRQRSYDHAARIAKEVARQKGLTVRLVVRRTRDDRQVGATRAERRMQVEGAFKAVTPLQGYKVLLIDDVCTTGATLTAAAQALTAAGAAEVWGGVVAWQPPKNDTKKDR
jgi:ComF family protein